MALLLAAHDDHALQLHVAGESARCRREAIHSDRVEAVGLPAVNAEYSRNVEQQLLVGVALHALRDVQMDGTRVNQLVGLLPSGTASGDLITTRSGASAAEISHRPDRNRRTTQLDTYGLLAEAVLPALEDGLARLVDQLVQTLDVLGVDPAVQAELDAQLVRHLGVLIVAAAGRVLVAGHRASLPLSVKSESGGLHMEIALKSRRLEQIRSEQT